MHQGYTQQEIQTKQRELKEMIDTNERIRRAAEKEAAWREAIAYHGTKKTVD